jgi:DnaJ-domain-containing protein 1
VALRYWKRMREQAALHATDPRPPGDNPWQDRVAPTLSQLGSSFDVADDDRAARYSDWAARLREKGAADRTEDTVASGPGYWSTEALFEDSRRLAREEGLSRGNPWVVRELLAVFDLSEGATSAELSGAYRRLAKQHHPDRFMEADPETRAFHEAEMRRVIDAYEALRQLSPSA